MSHSEVRLLSLLSLLQSQRTWNGGELAERLQVSPRTVRNDIDRLRELGYAVEGTRGGEGGYRLGSGGSALPPLLLDAEEAVAVAVGLRTGVNCIIGGMEETSVRALGKLEQTLPTQLRSRVRNLNRYTVPLPSNHPMPIVDPAVLTALVELCHSRHRLRFWYRDATNGNGDRAAAPGRVAYEVEPYRLVNQRHRWYLLGFDTGAGDWAVWEVDRIRPRTPPGRRFASRELPAEDVAAYVFAQAPSNVWRHRATVRLHVPAAEVEPLLAGAEGQVEPVDEHECMLRIGGQTLRGIALALGRLGVDFTVLDPPELKAEVEGLARRFAAAIRS